MSQVLALLSGALFGIADFTGGLASRTISAWRVTAWSQLLGIPLLLIGLATISESSYTTQDLLFGIVAGSFGLIGISLFYMALAGGTMSLVSPIVGVISTSIPVVWGLSTGESFGASQWIGIVAAITSIVLIAGQRSHTRPPTRIVLQALAAAVGFAVFFIAMGQTSQTSGLWPLLAARLVTVPVAFSISAITSTAAMPRHSGLSRIAFIGVADIGANIAVLLAIQTGSIGITAVLAGLYPAFTALAAIAILRERPTLRQRVGIAIAVMAGAMLTI
ncbi:MAG: DMT family transporter [Actinomycetota bacterium]